MTPRLHRLLVPVDYSPEAKEAIEYAAALAAGDDAELILVHVVEPTVPPTPAYVPPLAGYSILHKDMLDTARAWLDELRPQVGGTRCRAIVRPGHPGDEVVAVAREEAVDAIVMATHGRSGLSRFLMGSTTEYVLRHAPVPVLALRTALLAPRPGPSEPQRSSPGTKAPGNS